MTTVSNNSIFRGPSFNRRDFLRTAAATAALGQSLTLRALTGSSDRLREFHEAKFGMFIHWGPYSLAGVDASWPIMTGSKDITEAEYLALPARFNPTLFNAHDWVTLARSAGQRYMVFTTKHHDGFCMFDSYYTDYKITRTPYGKDIVAQLADACHVNGMGLGLYYSPPDMHHPAYRDTSKPATTNYRGEPTRPEWPLLLDYISLQLHELLTRYGKVMEIWFDSVDWRTRPFYDGQRFIDEVHRLQPDTLINDRLGIPCDFVTAEQYVPKAIPEKGVNYSPQDKAAIDKLPLAPPRPQDFQPWEACMTINDTWAYRPKDHNFKSADKLIRTLIEVISRGGNFLLDIGPKPDGLIQQEFVDRLQQVGAWALANSAAIYGSTYGPVQGQPAYRTTSRGNSTYVFVMDDAAQEIILPHGKPVQHVRLISDNRPVKFHSSVAGTRIPIDASLRDAGIPVLEIR